MAPIFDLMGSINITYAMVLLSVVSFLISLVSIVLLTRTKNRLKKFMTGSGGKDLEGLVSNHHTSIVEFELFRKQSIDYFKFLDDRIRKKIGLVETVRFNPFQGSGGGGNQSFSTAFVDEVGNGVVFSGIYSRDRTMVFSKPIVDWKSEFELTDEEKKAISASKSKNNVSK